ncbi:MAG TPA: nucleotidyltransferase family protein [Puia sp.]|jgi:molybdenum cofactor cytidylyltransferase
MSRVGVIILAAGNSSRLGRPKQLLPYRGKILLMHVVYEALAAELRPVVVVTGAYRAEVEAVLPSASVSIVYNEDWEKGMASGIVAGLTNLRSLQANPEAVIITVCDQPYISAALLLELTVRFDTSGKGIVGCGYADSVGTPVLFGRAYYERLLALSGSDGAKKLLKQYTNDLAVVDFPLGVIDIDTEEDRRKLEG